MKRAMISVPVLGLLWGVCSAGETVEITSDNDKISYSVGYQIGGDFKRQDMDLNSAVLLKGIEDALSGSEPLLNPQEQRATLVELKKQVAARKQEAQKKAAQENLDKAQAFLAENAKKEGVKTLPSGLQYKELKAGEGKTPGPEDKVTVQYRGSLIDGTEFDSSYKRGKPATFQVNRVIKGWTEAMQLMKEGSMWELYIPPELAYGDRGAGGTIPPNSALVFEVELISVN